MKDFCLNDTDKNLVLTNFDFCFATELEDYVSQKLRITLSIMKGEYYLDTDLGIPFIENVFVKDPNLDFISDLYKKTILSVEQVKEITTFELRYDKPTRRLTANFTVKVADTTVTVTV